jgi:hypothetical protein
MAAASSATRSRWLGSCSPGTRSSEPPITRLAATRSRPSRPPSTWSSARTVTSSPPTFRAFDVTVQDNYLVISGNRNAEERKEGDNYFIYERRYGNFSRAFALPENADPESVEATMNSGVLEVKVGKRESAKPRKIPLGQRLKEKLTK